VVEQLGAESYLYLRVAGVEVIEQTDRPGELTGSICVRLTEPADPRPGEAVSLAVRPEQVRLFDGQTGASRLPAG
jgi:hypothetical protein